MDGDCCPFVTRFGKSHLFPAGDAVWRRQKSTPDLKMTKTGSDKETGEAAGEMAEKTTPLHVAVCPIHPIQKQLWLLIIFPLFDVETMFKCND